LLGENPVLVAKANFVTQLSIFLIYWSLLAVVTSYVIEARISLKFYYTSFIEGRSSECTACVFYLGL